MSQKYRAMLASWVDYAEDAWREYWYPPTPQELLRRSKSRICRDCTKLRTEVARHEAAHDSAVKRLASAPAETDPEVLRKIAVDAAREKIRAARVRASLRMAEAAEGHVETSQTSAMLRETMRNITQAIGATADGG